MTRLSFRCWEDYEDENGVLVNLLGITDAEQLARAEVDLAMLRLAELEMSELPGTFDLRHLLAVHEYIFQDVYAWAGQIRVGPEEPRVMSKEHEGAVYSYAYTDYIRTLLDEQFERIRKADQLRGMPYGTFLLLFADIWAEVNFAHPFREGNTRTQFAFFTALAREAGWYLNPKPFMVGGPLRTPFVQARFSAHSGTSAGLADVLGQALSPIRTPPYLAVLVDMGSDKGTRCAWVEPGTHARCVLPAGHPGRHRPRL